MIYAFLADGFEETEAIAPIDILKRFGKEVVTVGVGGGKITGAHGISITADITDNDVIMTDKVEMIVLPGGMPGTLNLEKSPVVQAAIKFCSDRCYLCRSVYNRKAGTSERQKGNLLPRL